MVDMNSLSDEDLIHLFSIRNVDDIKSSEVIDDFRDDGEMCVNAAINDVPIDFLWCGWQGAAAIEYEYKEHILEMMKDVHDRVYDYVKNHRPNLIDVLDRVEAVAADQDPQYKYITVNIKLPMDIFGIIERMVKDSNPNATEQDVLAAIGKSCAEEYLEMFEE